MGRKIVAPQRRKQITDALFDCLAEKEYESITVKDIAHRADVHYGVIHYYFKNKDEIVLAMSDSIVSRYNRLRLNRYERIRRSRSAKGKLRATIDYLVDFSVFNRRLNRVFHNLLQMSHQNGAVRSALRRMFRDYRALVAADLKEGIENGEFRLSDSRDGAWLVVALVEGMALQRTIEPRAVGRAEVSKLITEVVMRYVVGS